MCSSQQVPPNQEKGNERVLQTLNNKKYAEGKLPGCGSKKRRSRKSRGVRSKACLRERCSDCLYFIWRC